MGFNNYHGMWSVIIFLLISDKWSYTETYNNTRKESGQEKEFTRSRACVGSGFFHTVGIRVITKWKLHTDFALCHIYN